MHIVWPNVDVFTTLTYREGGRAIVELDLPPLDGLTEEQRQFVLGELHATVVTRLIVLKVL
jgi:hypothetical protein